MLTNRDEILIQRCVDGELNHDERRELLARMDQLPEGWRTLACTFMEEQLFADAANESLQASPSPAANRQRPAAPSSRKQTWFASPVTTLVLSLCVAFLGGLLASGRFRDAQNASPVFAENTTTDKAARDTVSPNAAPRAATTVANAPYKMRVEPVGAEPVELPVFADADAFLKQLEEYRRREYGNAEMRSVPQNDGDLQFMRITTPDGKVIVLPVPRQSHFLQ